MNTPEVKKKKGFFARFRRWLTRRFTRRSTLRSYDLEVPEHAPLSLPPLPETTVEDVAVAPQSDPVAVGDQSPAIEMTGSDMAQHQLGHADNGKDDSEKEEDPRMELENSNEVEPLNEMTAKSSDTQLDEESNTVAVGDQTPTIELTTEKDESEKEQDPRIDLEISGEEEKSCERPLNEMETTSKPSDKQLSDNDHTYDQLLAHNDVTSEKNAERFEVVEKQVMVMKVALVLRTDNKETRFVNFEDACKCLRRQQEHVRDYILA